MRLAFADENYRRFMVATMIGWSDWSPKSIRPERFESGVRVFQVEFRKKKMHGFVREALVCVLLAASTQWLLASWRTQRAVLHLLDSLDKRDGYICIFAFGAASLFGWLDSGRASPHPCAACRVK